MLVRAQGGRPMAIRTQSALPAKVLSSLVLAGTLVLVPAGAARPGSPASPGAVTEMADVPEVLRGDNWLRHHRDDLMPYWDMPAALGDPVGNFPSFRGRDGELLPEFPNRGLSTLARGVYGYSLAFSLTGEERYLTYARAGIDWINAKAKDPVHGGYYGDLAANGEPVNPTANKDVFDLASLGLAYGMYFNVTRDPAAEADLLAVRDLLFEKYYDPVTNRVKDTLTYDLLSEVDTGNNGGDITNLLVPGTAIFLPNAELLTDPDRRVQFRNDLRTVTEILIARHKRTTGSNRWWFWGRTRRFGNLDAQQTDFGHNIKSYEMIHNANKMFADRPWSGLGPDRDVLLTRAWDEPAARWNQRMVSFTPDDAVVRDSEWWIHAEADQTLAALDLGNGFAHRDQLARSAQSWLDVFVDDESPARETFARIARGEANNDRRKSFFGKNMLHAHEHALVMYLHGRALEDRPARLFYAFPESQALTAVAKPYWFDASGESRTVVRDIETLPGHKLVDVRFSGIDAVPAPPYPAPDDTVAPTTNATVTPDATAAEWHNGDVTISLSADDDLVGVKEIHARIEERGGALPGAAFIGPGEELALPTLHAEGAYDITYFAVDRLGNRETAQTLIVRIDRTDPAITGLPPAPCVIWPPNQKMVHAADVEGSDALSGVADLQVTGSSSEPAAADDIRIVGGSVDLRAIRDDEGPGRTYTLVAWVTDRAGNTATAVATCLVPHHRQR
jgi:mannose/cellobiose epimerase-like protein (N-acyl-D-glucosamine 2-epimerase family)